MVGSVLVAGITYYATPKYTRVGYQPTQPVSYNHEFHAGELGIDCRYCHSGVDKSSHANIPGANVCMSCHQNVKADSALLKPVRDSYYGEDTNKDGKLSDGEDLNGDGILNAGPAIPWVRIHKAPDYVYFNHAIHVNRGISCVECHGRVDTMDEVWQVERLSMGWCLECHRDPAPHVRDPDLVTQLEWGWDMEDAERIAEGAKWQDINNLQPSQDCTTCHR